MSRRLLLTAMAATLALAACGNTGDAADPTDEAAGSPAHERTGADTPATTDADAPEATGDATPADEAAGADTSAGSASGGAVPAGELTVFAAASLHVVFEDIADRFTERYPDTEVAFSFAGSADLVAQLDAGAPADVLATADEPTMADAVGRGTIDGAPEVFAENMLTLATPAGNPAGITGLDDSLDGANLVVCAPQVPCGAATQTLAANLDIALRPVSEEGNVTDVLGKVTTGQADAGLVYTTDAAAAGDAVDVVPLVGAQDVVNRYPIAVTTAAEDPDLARTWVEFVLGPEAQEVLDAAGFGAP